MPYYSNYYLAVLFLETVFGVPHLTTFIFVCVWYVKASIAYFPSWKYVIITNIFILYYFQIYEFAMFINAHILFYFSYLRVNHYNKTNLFYLIFRSTSRGSAYVPVGVPAPGHRRTPSNSSTSGNYPASASISSTPANYPASANYPTSAGISSNSANYSFPRRGSHDDEYWINPPPPQVWYSYLN
jgi:hypothetical protein